jgi:hypothetical protein
MDVQQICPNCMAVKGGQVVCPICGMDDCKRVAEPQALPTSTILQGKYLLGQLQGSGDVSRSLSVVLKLGYVPSEQYSSRGKQGPWTDVYAVAAKLYSVVTGVVPADAMVRIEEDTPQPLGGLVEGVPPLVDQAAIRDWRCASVSAGRRWRRLSRRCSGISVKRIRASCKLRMLDLIE